MIKKILLNFNRVILIYISKIKFYFRINNNKLTPYILSDEQLTAIDMSYNKEEFINNYKRPAQARERQISF